MKELLKLKYLLILIGYLAVIGIYYYFTLPIINFRNPGFYIFLAMILTLPGAIIWYFACKSKSENATGTYTTFKYDKRRGSFVKVQKDASEKYETNVLLLTGAIVPAIVTILLVVVFSLTGLKIFNAKAYSNQLVIDAGSSEDLNTIFDYEKGEVLLPEIDKDLAFRLAEACLGDYGSQYTIDYENFTLISVNRNNKTELIRVTPLEYATPFVAMSKSSEGTIGYIEVNVITKEAKLVKFDDGLKYMPSGIFGYDLERYIRFNYPTVMYQHKYFEIDNDGNPYWVIPTNKKEIGVFDGSDPCGVIVLSPITGESNYYELNASNMPEWIQRVVDEKVVEAQANNALTYKNGFFNTLFAKKEVFQLSDGYNYFIKDGHTYYVSCITSPNLNDQTSTGFIIINLQTKQSIKYSSPGITEMRAREIAEGDERVKAQALDSTWPILITYHNEPTYFVVLKNSVQPQKFVLINVSDGTLVAMGDTLDVAKQEYEKLLAGRGAIDQETTLTKTVTVTDVRDLTDKIEFMISGDDSKYYVVDVNVSLDARFLSVGDTVTITYKEISNYNLVISLEKE